MVSLRRETATAIEEIRRLVYAMRPPALDELGLVGALRQPAEGLRLDVVVRSSGAWRVCPQRSRSRRTGS